jgi:hypothetical protein
MYIHPPGSRGVSGFAFTACVAVQMDVWAIRHLVYRSAKSSNLIISFFFWP